MGFSGSLSFGALQTLKLAAFPPFPKTLNARCHRLATSTFSVGALSSQPSLQTSPDNKAPVASKRQSRAAIDFKWIGDNRDVVASNTKNRNSDANLDLVLQLYKSCSLQKEVERLHGERNVVANKMKAKLEASEWQKLVEEGKNLKGGLMALEEDLVQLTS